MNLRKKLKFLKLYRALSGQDSPEAKILGEIISELETIKKEPGKPGYTPIKGKDYFDGQTPTKSELLALMKPLLPDPQSLKGEPGIAPTVEDIKTAVLPELLSRIPHGGGNMSRDIRINGSVISTYGDLNFIGSIAAVQNNTSKYSDVYFSGGSGGSPLTVSDGSTSVPNVTLLKFVSNATVSNAGGGEADVAVTGGVGSGITRQASVITASLTAGGVALTDYVYIATAGLQIQLPTASGNKNLYTIKNGSNSSVLVSTTSAQTIDGSPSATIYIQNQSLDIIGDNSNWRIV